MSDRVQKAADDLNYPFLLVAHMVCADRQIHSEELKALRELALQIEAGEGTLEEMEKIFAQDDHHMSVEAIAKKVPPGQQSEAIWQMLAIAYADGFCSALELEMAERVAQVWYWPEGEIQRRLEQAGAFADTRFISDCNDRQKLSFAARLLKGGKSVLSRALVDKLTEMASEKVRRQVEQLRREKLLGGPEYDKAIRQCAVIADEDYKFAEVALISS